MGQIRCRKHSSPSRVLLYHSTVLSYNTGTTSLYKINISVKRTDVSLQAVKVLGEYWYSSTRSQTRKKFKVRPVAYPGFFFWWGVSTNSVEDRGQRERGSGGGRPLVRGFGGGSNLVQEISLYIVKFSNFLVL